ncbi:MAG TPA: bis(5'-nucleosyl)-tetraphosphatase (symmetrical) YqeK [Xenococcaceae cyanobacterium]|jgi:predicted HD superfamily hydrolase involved in NAD metabolism
MVNYAIPTKLRERTIVWLKANVSPKRLRHILGVEATCIQLARSHQLNEQQAAQAGLMHDLAKFFPPQKLLKIAQDEAIAIDSICYHHPHLLHADVSAIVANQEFGIKDPEVLAAIQNHTLGSPEMGLLSCVVYVADAIEPHRGDTPELNHLRQLATNNLYQSVQQTSDYSLNYLVKSGKVIHPRTVLTRNWALAKSKQLLK